MEARELRIGNWVEYKGKPISVNGLVDVDVFGMQVLSGNDEIDIDKIKPIPLTPEILQACGLKDVTKEYVKQWFININRSGLFLDKISSVGTKFEVCIDMMWFENSIPISTDRVINYLHELQNLFFALTGTELAVNLSEPASLSA